MQKITILGGADGFGLRLTKYIYNNFGEKCELTISDINQKKGKEISKKIGINFTNNNKQAVKKANIIILAVPINQVEKVIKEISKSIKNNSIIADVVSIKGLFIKTCKKHIKKNVKIIPTHPMFGPFINNIDGQNFVLTPDDRIKNTKEYKRLKKYIKKQNAKFIETNAEYHDKVMAIIQGLTHFNLFVMGATLSKLKINFDEIDEFVSPVYKMLNALISRYGTQNPRLYANIQIFNEEILPIHEIFMKTTKDLSKIVEKKDINKFINYLKETKEYFLNQKFSGQKYTDKIIYFEGEQTKKLHQNLNKKVNIKNIYNNNFKTIKISKISKNNFEDEYGNKYDINEYIIN